MLRHISLDRTRPRIHPRSYEESANVSHAGLLLLGGPHRGISPQLHRGGERTRWEDGGGRFSRINLEGKPLALSAAALRAIACVPPLAAEADRLAGRSYLPIPSP